MQKSIDFLKARMFYKADQWKSTKEKNLINDMTALCNAINILEQRVYGKQITNLVDTLR